MLLDVLRAPSSSTSTSTSFKENNPSISLPLIKNTEMTVLSNSLLLLLLVLLLFFLCFLCFFFSSLSYLFITIIHRYSILHVPLFLPLLADLFFPFISPPSNFFHLFLYFHIFLSLFLTFSNNPFGHVE